MASLKIYENLRTVSYAPFYLADRLGLFSQQALDVEIIPSPSPVETAQGLLAGRVDVAWGGPMRVMKHHDQDPDCPLVCFCKVVGPEPFSLVGREAVDRFDFHALLGRRVGVMTDVPTPWLTLQEDLRRSGIDPQALDQGPARTMADNVVALAKGEVDVVQVMEPYTEAAVQAGGHLWHPFALRGDVVFTSFYTTRQFATRESSTCQALSQAMGAALRKIRTDSPTETAAAITDWFPDLSQSHLSNSIQRYIDTGIWPSSTRMSESAFVRLKGALLSGEFIGTDVPYERAVLDQLSQ